jgi:AcrR family transcriptional regulator
MALATDPPASALSRPRVPGAERREALIRAAVHEFALTGLHGTPVARIAQRVGVAQPYVFSFFPNKLELFLAAVERCFDLVAETFRRAASDYRDGHAPAQCTDALAAMGYAYKQLLCSDRDTLMLQHQAFAACEEQLVSDRMRLRYAELFRLVQDLSGAEPERLDEFFRLGMGHCMTLNVVAAMNVQSLSISSGWVDTELE